MPTVEGTSIRVVDDQSDYDCKYVGVVTGSGSMGWTPAHDAEGALNEVRNRAAELGANAIRLMTGTSSVFTSVVMAEALKCDFNS